MKKWVVPNLEELNFKNTACTICEEELSGEGVTQEDYGRCTCGGQYHQPNQSTDPNPYHKDNGTSYFETSPQNVYWKP